MATSPNFTIVTLGVADLSRSITFYRALGWEQRGNSDAGITWFKTSGTWIGLYNDAELADDANLPLEEHSSYRGITLALNFNTTNEVDAAIDEAVAAGARLIKPATKATWGGYSGYFADPDGHLWEVAYAPGLPVADDGTIEITD